MLKINNLSCGYKNTTVLEDINLDIAESQVIGIVGPNGCGKSTLVKTITSLLNPLSGDIFLKEENMKNLSRKEIAKHITLLKQNSDVVPFTVLDFVLTGRIAHRTNLSLSYSQKDLEIAHNALKATDAFALKDKLLTNLSGGEVQLCKIAKALSQEPKLLIMDEPNTGLDISHSLQIMNLIKKLNKDLNLTVLMVLHDLNLASFYCDKIAVLANKSLYGFAPPKDIITKDCLKDVYNTSVSVLNREDNASPYIVIP